MSRRPVNDPYTITTEFGEVDSYAKFGYHSGVDYAVPLGRPVYAPKSGVLTNVVSPTGGNMVTIFDGQFTHRAMHNNAFARQNGSVQEGDLVAYAGTTGLSTGPHCHWDISAEGVYPTSFAAFRDPWQWLQGAYEPPKPVDPVIAPTQRLLTNPTGVNQREQPSTAARIIKEWPLDDDPIFNFKGYVIGETVNGNNVWFVGAVSGGYFYSGAFQGGADTTGLANLTPTTPVEPPVTPPVEPPVTFVKEVDCVTLVAPAHPSNYEVGNFPAMPLGMVLHDFGTDGVDTFAGSMAHFAKPNTTAPHFTVSGKNIVQNGKLSWRMYHAGPLGNDKIGIEIDPDVDTNIDTKNSVLTLMRQLDEKYKTTFVRYLHSQFMATACGDDVQKANLLIPPTAPTSPKDDEQDKRLSALEAAVKALSEKIDKIMDFLASIFSGFKK